MIDASRLADLRRAEYGEEEMANNVRAVGMSVASAVGGTPPAPDVLTGASTSANTADSIKLPYLKASSERTGDSCVSVGWSGISHISGRALQIELYLLKSGTKLCARVWQTCLTNCARHMMQGCQLKLMYTLQPLKMHWDMSGDSPSTLSDTDPAESETGSGGNLIPTNCPGTV